MSDDLVSRLRDYNADSPYLTELLDKAADEIELLGKIVREQLAEIEDLKAADIDPMDVIRDYEERAPIE